MSGTWKVIVQYLIEESNQEYTTPSQTWNEPINNYTILANGYEITNANVYKIHMEGWWLDFSSSPYQFRQWTDEINSNQDISWSNLTLNLDEIYIPSWSQIIYPENYGDSGTTISSDKTASITTKYVVVDLKLKDYLVTIDTDGGNVNLSTGNYQHGTIINMPLTGTKLGFVLSHFTSSIGHNLFPGESLTLNEEVTISVHWGEEYTIILSSKNEVEHSNKIILNEYNNYVGENNLTMTIENLPKVIGYTFKKWISKDGTEEFINNKIYDVKEQRIYYATWEEKNNGIVKFKDLKELFNINKDEIKFSDYISSLKLSKRKNISFKNDVKGKGIKESVSIN